MAKKRKPTTKSARRAARRGKQTASDVVATGETSVAAENAIDNVEQQADNATPTTSNNDQTTEISNTDPATKPMVPIISLHKKFGKYRCLLSDDTLTRKYEIGSDSETSSSVEIKVVDPCASSESDSNVALDAHSDTTSRGGSPSMLDSMMMMSCSRDMSPVNVPSDEIETYEIPLPEENIVKEPVILEPDIAEIPLPEITIENENTEPDIQVPIEEIEIPPEDPPPEVIIDNNEVIEEEIQYICEGDDEVMTVIQIVEDDNNEMYYDINISPKNDPEHTEQQTDFQEHFEKLNLETEQANISMECATEQKPEIPDLQVARDTLEALSRPDPSLTPSSVMSDDSNSSRATELNVNNSNESAESSPTGVRRSSRLKTISSLKQKTKGTGLVKTPLKKALITQTKLKLEEVNSDSNDKSSESIANTPSSPSFPVPSDMPVKVKSRWRRSSELEMCASSPANSPLASPNLPRLPPVNENQDSQEVEEKKTVPLSKEAYDKIISDRMNQYQHLEENEYLCDRMVSKDTKKMICDCFLTKEELERGEYACGEDCLNRLLMIECNSRCPVGDRCANRKFQKRDNASLKVFYADKKGCGVNSDADISSGEFLMEYVGEVLDYEQFYKRAQTYSDENNLHHYFMSLKGDTVIDATLKGNISRFINHSCDPNAETQKWTVNGELRIGFFSKREIKSGEEITFDYQFQRFGKVAQRCYCGAETCRGWIGAEPDSDDEYEEEEEDVSTSKSGSSEVSSERALPEARSKPPRRRRRDRSKPAPELLQDADIEEDLEALSRTGVKNQCHTLRLSRTVVRAKSRRVQEALLRLLRDADLPCRRLFLDYRGLRLLAPWCSTASLQFKLEMLQTVDRLPITNKTMVQESRFFTIVEKWMTATETVQDNVFIDESTGLPVDLPNRSSEETQADRSKDLAAIQEKVKELCSQLLERWSSLKEVYKIPKKERIQQMKEHERQANVERRAADSSGSRDRERERERERDRERERERERDRERERERERDRERERERERDRYRERDDRDRRKRRNSPPDNRRSLRTIECAPLTKEQRRRAFAEAAAAAERAPPAWRCWPSVHNVPPQIQQLQQLQMFPPAVPGLVPGADADYPPYVGQFPAGQFCMPQTNMLGGMYGNMGYMFPPQLPFNQEISVPPPQPPQNPPIPDPSTVVLPSMWRSAQDSLGRTYYYHVKLRRPQWNPPAPPPPPETDEEESSEEEQEAQINIDAIIRRPKGKLVEGVNGVYEVIKDSSPGLIPDRALVNVKQRKRRPGLVTERPISPRTEEDKLAGRLEVKRYKQTKEKLRRRKERLLQKVKLLAAARKRGRDVTAHELKMIELGDSDSDSDEDSDLELLSAPPSPLPAPPAAAPPPPPAPAPAPAVDLDEMARKIKEQFRSNMARIMVQHLNPYRHSEAKMGRITNTADFKHLARKLTHFVMLKELKHCRSVDELIVTESVKTKAKTFVKKYMAKFGPVYKRPDEEND